MTAVRIVTWALLAANVGLAAWFSRMIWRLLKPTAEHRRLIAENAGLVMVLRELGWEADLQWEANDELRVAMMALNKDAADAHKAVVARRAAEAMQKASLN